MERVEQFWENVEPTGFCWEWVGPKTKFGYGNFWDGSKSHKAHRAAYMALIGPIPAGMVLDHLCRNTACVNPDHLEPVTQAENVRRGYVGANMRARTHCPQGHPFGEDNTRINIRGARVCRTCDKAANARRPRTATCDMCGSEVHYSSLARHKRRVHRIARGETTNHEERRER